MTHVSDIRIYSLRISGTVDADFLVSYCPPGTTMVINEDTITLANLHSDQAGILGIIRHLHNFGCVVLALDTN